MAGVDLESDVDVRSEAAIDQWCRPSQPEEPAKTRTASLSSARPFSSAMVSREPGRHCQ